jgi:hypothetical protein
MSMLQTFLDQRHKYRHFVPLCRIFQFQLCDPYKGGESTGCLVVLPGPELAVSGRAGAKSKLATAFLKPKERPVDAM